MSTQKLVWLIERMNLPESFSDNLKKSVSVMRCVLCNLSQQLMFLVDPTRLLLCLQKYTSEPYSKPIESSLYTHNQTFCSTPCSQTPSVCVYIERCMYKNS
jgi:hypothetical protein